MHTTLKHKETGKEHSLNIVKFTGKIYEPGFTLVNGRPNFTDKVGKPDNRFMVFGSSFQLKVYNDIDAIESDFETVSGSPRIDHLRSFI